MALFKVTGPPDEVDRLRYLAENLDLVKHVVVKMQVQKLAPKDQLIIVVDLAENNELGMKFMRQCVDPEFERTASGQSFACNVEREQFKSFLEPNAPADLAIAEDDIGPGMYRMVVLARNGITRMDAHFDSGN